MKFAKFLILIPFFSSLALGMNFPQDWRGTWSGRMVPSDGGKSYEMELEIKEKAGSRAYHWRIQYSGQEIRDYLLISDPKKPGHFVIDEQNGIQLLGHFAGDTFRTFFYVGGQLIDMNYRLENERIRVDIVSFDSTDFKDTKSGQHQVRSYRLSSTSSAILTQD